MASTDSDGDVQLETKSHYFRTPGLLWIVVIPLGMAILIVCVMLKYFLHVVNLLLFAQDIQSSLIQHANCNIVVFVLRKFYIAPYQTINSRALSVLAAETDSTRVVKLRN